MNKTAFLQWICLQAVTAALVLFGSAATAENDMNRLPLPLKQKAVKFFTDIKARNHTLLLSYFDPKHVAEFAKISDRKEVPYDDAFINIYVIETIGLWGENAVQSLGEIASMELVAAEDNGDGTFTLRFTALLKNGRKVRGWFFVDKNSALFSGPYG